MNDLYVILQVPKTATAEEIKKSYRKLAQQYHPDTSTLSDAEKKFKELSAAYDILGNPAKRKEYDQYGTVRSSNQRRDPVDDFFSNFFKENVYQGEHGEHIVTSVTIDLHQVATGCDTTVSYVKKQLCEKCNGKGGEQGTCRQCNGKGSEILHGEGISVKRPCSNCKGSGHQINEKCSDCKGSGFDADIDCEIIAAIPPGVEHGIQIMFKGLGQPGKNGGRSGHLVVFIQVKEHVLFQRISKGDLLIKYPVTYGQLVFGHEIELPTVTGDTLNVRIPAGTQPGVKMRLSKQGLPTNHTVEEHPKPLDHGDLYVEMKLEIPTNVTSEEFLNHICVLERFDKNWEFYPARNKFNEQVSNLGNKDV